MNVIDCIFFQLTKATQAGVLFYGHRVAHLDITATQALVLNSLFEQDRIPSHVLSNKLRITSATTTGILDRLVRSGLVERIPNPEDRRAVLVCLTDKGREVAAEVRKVVETANADFLACLSPDEELFFRGLLKRLAGQAQA
ncbi:MAG: MarR family winged helix-turn-helix transcriptional regulator [Desulfatibacillaceae bacterium]